MSLIVNHLTCEYLTDPLGIDVRQPRLSWKLQSDQRGAVQTAYQIRITDDNGTLWDSGKVLTDRSIHIPYAGQELQSRQRCTWQVRVWDATGLPSSWSANACWEMGMLKPTDWAADWIEPEWFEDPKAFKPSPFLRQAFSLKQEVSSARLYITCHGLYEAWINGQRVGDQVFTPGFTSYDTRLQYQVYDVTQLVHGGENVLGAILGDGWYRGKIYVMDSRNVYGTRLGLLAQIHLRFTDGSQSIITSDKDWKAKTGPILKSDMKDGEEYDARLEMPGWDAPGFDDTAWLRVRVVDIPKDNLVASMGVPIRRKETFTPAAILNTPNGETVVDMGQNFAGVVQMKVSGPRGTVIKLRHGEALDKDGNFTMANFVIPGPIGHELLQQNQYTLKGVGEEIYEPHFTVHGFRYVKVEGFPGEPAPNAFTGIAIYSDMSPTGTFECSDPLINQLHHNVEWSQKSNFLDLPTDCPTRERAGWTGDAQIFCRTGSFVMDTAAFFTKWLKDLKAGQNKNGMVSNFSPNPFGGVDKRGLGGVMTLLEGSSGWGDAAVIVPWTLYLTFGDQRILEEQYDSMKAWVEYERACARKTNWSKVINPSHWFDKNRLKRQKYIWDTKYQWGEWLEPGDNYGNSSTMAMLKRVLFGDAVVATAYFAYSSRLLAETARILGKTEDAREYSELADAIKAAYIAEFISPEGRIEPDKQATYVRALQLDLAPRDLRPALLGNLVRLIHAANIHIGTGFLSTPFLCHVLSENGQLELAYALLNQKTIPSWLYSITKGATTIWESWEGISEDGTPHASLNHYSYGAVAGWLHRVVAGIEIGEPGYKRILIQPQPGGGLTHARAAYHSIYGEIEAAWELSENEFTLKAVIPANTTAMVFLPAQNPSGITESNAPLEGCPGIIGVTQQGGAIQVDIGSGTYKFKISF